jgi:hypothetical protein
MAAAFTAWQGYEAHQARLDAKEAAEKARAEAKDASNNQWEAVKASRKAAEDSSKAAQELATGMNRSAKAAEASAEAGRESVLISKRSLQLSERPTLESIDGKLSAPVTAGVAPEITVDTYNTGKGPAYSVRIEQVASIGSTFTFKFFDKIAVHADVMGIGSTAGRAKLTTISNLPPLTESQFQDIVSGRKKLFVYGAVSFEEMTLPRPTAQAYTYCYYYDPADTGKTRLIICPVTPSIPGIGIAPQR